MRVKMIYSYSLCIYGSTGVGESGFKCWGVKGLAFLFFLFNLTVSDARAVSVVIPIFYDSSSLGYPPIPWFILRVRRSIPLVPS